MQEVQKPNKAIVAVIIVVLLAAVAAGTIYLLGGDQESSETSQDQAPSSTTESKNADTTTSSGAYSNGTYTATGGYQSPGGRESIEVTLAINDGKITSASATTKAASSTSRQYQSEFVDNFKTLVVGKNIDEVKLSRVAGSSLTSNGFNDALEQIKDEANA